MTGLISRTHKTHDLPEEKIAGVGEKVRKEVKNSSEDPNQSKKTKNSNPVATQPTTNKRCVVFLIGDEDFYSVGDAIKKNLEKFTFGGAKIYGVFINIGGNNCYSDDHRSQIRRVATNKTVTNLGIFCHPTPNTSNWKSQLENLVQDVGRQIPVMVLNFLPKDDFIQNIRASNETRHKNLVLFKNQVANYAYEQSYALVEPFVPVGNIFHGLDEVARNKLMASKFEKMASLAINTFKSKANADQETQPSGSALINPALLPDSPEKRASNGCPTGNTLMVTNQPDAQLTNYIAGLTSVMNSNSKIMEQIAAQNLAQQTRNIY